MPYQVFGESPGALAVTIAWIRLAMVRSAGGISAIFASRAFSPSAFWASAFSSRARSLMAERSKSLNPSAFLRVVGLADLRVLFFAGFFSGIARHLLGQLSWIGSNRRRWYFERPD